MKINQIILSEMTTAGAVATVAKPMGETQKRPMVRGLEPAEKVMSGKTKKKGPYANSLSEGKVKELSMDLKSGRDGLTDVEFKKKYGKTKEEMRKAMQQKPEPVKEAKLDEDDLILIPGQGMKRKTGFVPHGQSRVDHEVEMARSDVLATMKNAKAIYELLKDRSEDTGLEGWVQEKLIKANDYLNSVKEYYDEKMMHEMNAGVIAAGGVGEGVAEAKTQNKQVVGFTSSDKFKTWEQYAQKEGYEIREAGNLPGSYAAFDDNGKRVGYFYNEFDLPNGYYYVGEILITSEKQGVAEGSLNEGQYEMMMRNGQVKKFIAKDDADAKRIAAGHGAKSVIRLKGGVPAGKVVEGSSPKEKQKTPYRDINSSEYRAAADKQRQQMARDKAAEPGKKLADKIAKKSVGEGAKVDRMVGHIKKSEIKTGKSKDEAENIAWATVNKRGYLDNSNKKKGK